MHRVEVRLKPHLPDTRGLGLVRDIHDVGITTVSDVRVVDIYWLDADLPSDKLELICHRLLADPVTQDYQYESGFTFEGEPAFKHLSYYDIIYFSGHEAISQCIEWKFS